MPDLDVDASVLLVGGPEKPEGVIEEGPRRVRLHRRPLQRAARQLSTARAQVIADCRLLTTTFYVLLRKTVLQ